VDQLQQDFVNESRQALARTGDPDGRGLSALQQVEQAPEDSWFDLAMNVAAQVPNGFWEGYTTLDGGAAPKSKAAEITRAIFNLWGFIGFIPDPGDFAAAPAKAALRWGTKGMKVAAAKRITGKAVKRSLLEDAARGALLTDSAKLINKAEEIAGARGYGQLLNGVLSGRSVPLLVGKGATSGLKTLAGVPLVARGATTAGNMLKGTKFFNNAEKLGILSDVGHSASVLGFASGMSALSINPAEWADRVDGAIGATAQGAIMGGAFGLLGNVGRVSSKLILDGKQSSAEHLIRTLAGSALTGLPATMQGRDTADQVYEYLLGGYFGFHATPWVSNRGSSAAAEAIKKNKEVSKSYLDQGDYGRFAEVTGVTQLRAESPAAGDIMMRELLRLHGLPPEQVSSIMRNPKKYVPLERVEPVAETTPEAPGLPLDIESAYDPIEQARLTREAWDAEYKESSKESSSYRQSWNMDWKNKTRGSELYQGPINIEWEPPVNLYKGPIEIDWGTPQQQKVDRYVLGARERARLTNANLVEGLE